MDRVDAIYQRHVAALERIGACGDAVRLSLRLALEELEEGVRGEARKLRQEIEALQDEADAEAHALRQELEVCREGAALITQQLAPAHAILHDTNGSHANPPYVLPEEAVKVLRADDVDAIRGSTWLRDDDREWLEGLERGAHSFRTVPKETRRRLVQAHIDAVRTDSEAPRQFDFDQSRPVWMPTAGSAAATFGISWADLCAARYMPY